MKNIPVRKITTSQKEQPVAGRFSIRDLQTLLGGKDLTHDLHRHDFFFILALEKGMGVHEIDFIAHKVQNNSVFILRPGQVHRLTLKAGSTGLLIEFDAAFYHPENAVTQQRWKKTVQKNHCEVTQQRFDKLYAILKNIFEEHRQKEEGYLDAIKTGLDLFSIQYIRQSPNPNAVTTAQNSYVQERFEELQLLLETRITELKNVSDYAALLSLSPYQLNNITKSAVGKTVSDLITAQLLLEAKRYLLATPSQVKDIAYHLGYEDISYFIRFFKKHTGLTPEAFRKI